MISDFTNLSNPIKLPIKLSMLSTITSIISSAKSIISLLTVQQWAIVVLVIIILYLLKYYSDLYKCSMIEVYHFGTRSADSFNLALLGGIHGNEPAGAVALTELINNGYFDRAVSGRNIHITVIPRANPCGLEKNMRYQPNAFMPDINRNFGSEYGTGVIAKNILNAFGKANLIIDFHEGWGWHKEDRRSVGSGVLPTNTELSKKIANDIVSELNKSIKEDTKKFSIVDQDPCLINTTLRCLMERKSRDYILVETTGQNDIQPLHIRTGQIRTVVDTVLKNI